MQASFSNQVIQLVASKSSDSGALAEHVQTVAQLASLFAGNENVQLVKAIADLAPNLAGAASTVVSQLRAPAPTPPPPVSPVPSAAPVPQIQPRLPAPQP